MGFSLRFTGGTEGIHNLVMKVNGADEETKKKLEAAAKRAAKDKERAIGFAVKKALREEEEKRKKAEAEAAGEEVSK